jgi:hypothetical protein
VQLVLNSFSGTITTSTTASTTPFIGSSDGSFISNVPAGKGNFVSYKMTFQSNQFGNEICKYSSN